MLQNIKCKYLIEIFILSVAVIFAGAFVIQTNNITNSTDLLFLDEYEEKVEDPLSFLSDFVVESILDPPLQRDFDNRTKKIVKRGAPTSPVPQYMLDVYERLSDKRIHVKFDTVRSFHSSGISTNLKFPNLTADVDYKDAIFYSLIFNISHFPPTESVLFAQLRIQTSFAENNKIFESQKIETYFLEEDSPILLTSRSFDPFKESLYTVNITRSFQWTVTNGKELLEFGILTPKAYENSFDFDLDSTEGPQLLVVSKSHKSEGVEDRIFSRLKRSLDEHSAKAALRVHESFNSTAKFSKALNNKSGDAFSPWRRMSRQKRSEEEDEEVEEQSNYIVEELGRIRKGKLKRKKNPCRRKPLHVNFAAINYDQWIIAPPSYEAFECTGKCSFPMSAHLAPTKHAIIQTLMHSLEPKQVSRASCVPIKLSPISILYVDDDGTVTYKYDYEDMVVAECGCR